MSKGRGAKAPIRDWLDRSEKPPSSQKGKPTATVKPIQASNANYNAFQSVFNTLCHSPPAPTLRAQSSCSQSNKANHHPAQSCSVKPQKAGPQKIDNHRPHVPTGSGVKGNVAKNNAVQININVHQGSPQKKPTPAGSVPKPNVPRKHHAPASSGVNNNVASQNAVQLNVNVSSNVKNTRPRSNNYAQHATNSAKPKLQCTPGTSHAPANQNKSNHSGGGKRNANSKKNSRTTVIVIQKN